MSNSLVSGVVAFVVATAAAGLVGRNRTLALVVGAFTGASVALSTWYASRPQTRAIAPPFAHD
ncbi:hypothetical protein ACFPYI_13460 [Halomarina salina]|uniref:Uncharacterized protein n=1 Tax=Halomarina salina TaxID=1872699 RepID=A0ABD5RPT3_9EURY|nr:hypothetical protein [Halomarina salina]